MSGLSLLPYPRCPGDGEKCRRCGEVIRPFQIREIAYTLGAGANVYQHKYEDRNECPPRRY